MATRKNKVDTTDWPKSVSEEDESVVLDLFFEHDIPSYQIALKFEIDPTYLRNWFRSKNRKYFERGERCTLLS